MKFNSKYLIIVFALIYFTFIRLNNTEAASITSAATGNWSSPTTWNIVTSRPGTITASTSSKTVTGTALASFTTTLSVGSQVLNTSNVIIGVVASIESATSLTLVANASAVMTNAGWNSRGIGPGDDVTIASGHTITVDNNFSCNTISFTAAATNNALTISGTNTLTVSGLVNMPNPNLNRNSIINVNDGTLVCGSLTTSGTTATRYTNINITTGVLDINGIYTSSNAAGTTISVSSTGVVYFGGAVSTLFTLSPGSSSTIGYDMLGAQTVRPVIYNNLIIGGSGTKTTTSVTINKDMIFEGTATISVAVTMGTSSGIFYNTTSARTVNSIEWPTTFAGDRGVVISSTGAITLNSSKTLTGNTNYSLFINPGATLNTANFALTVHGNYANSGTLNAGSSNFTITGTMSTQTIGSISTTGTITMSKTSGTAYLTAGISAGTLSLNGTGGTLDLGIYTHTFGNVNLSNGTINAIAAYINISGNVTSTTGVFNQNSSTVDFNGATTQSSSIVNFYNLIFSGSGSKSSGSGSLLVENNLIVKGNATFNTTTNVEILGDLIAEETGTINIGVTNLTVWNNLTIGNGSSATLIISNAAGGKTVNGDFTVNSNAVYNNTGNEILSIGGNVTLNGTLTFGTAPLTLTGISKSINSNSSIAIPSLTINGSYTNNIDLTITSSLAGTGTLTNATNSILSLTNNSITIANIDASSNVNTVNYNLSGTQTIFGVNYFHLGLSGSGLKTFQSGTGSIIGNLTLSGTVNTSFAANLILTGNLSVSSGSTYTAGSLNHTIKGNIIIASGGMAIWTGSTLVLNGSKQSYTDLNSTKFALNNLTAAGNGLKTVTVASVLGNVIINNNDSLLFNNTTLSINGTTTIGAGSSGYLNLQSTSGSKTFNGDFTVNTNAIFDNSHTNVTFAGNTTFNGSFYAGAGTYTYTGANKTISGSAAISLINLTINGTITLNSTSSLNVSGSFAGTGILINASTLFITTSTEVTINKLNASSFPNIVHYSGTNQNIFGTNYYNLSLSGSGIKLMPNALDSIYGNLSISGTVTFNSNDNVVILGNLTTTTGTTISIGNYTYTIGGNMNIGTGTTFNFNNSNFNFNGGAQTITNATTTSLVFANVSLTGGQKTFANNTYFNGTLTINSNATLLVGATSTMYFNCIFSGTGKIVGSNCSALTFRNLSFEMASSNMGTVYIDQTNNAFSRITIKNNGSINIINDVQIFDYLDLNSGTITINNTIYFVSTNTPIIKTSGFLNMTSNSSIYFGGCNASGNNFTIPTSTFLTSPTLVNFTVGRTNGISLGTNNISVSGSLNILAGTLAISTGSLRLLSTSSNTARVSTISGSSSVTGTITVDRFIPGGSNKRKWRFLSAPVNIAGSNSFAQYIDDIFVTAPAGTAGGFDNSPQNNASIRTYNETTSGAANLGWTNPTNINNTISTGTGVEVFVRGSRSLANPYLNWTVPDDVTIDYNGTLNIGTFDVGLSYTNTGNSSADGFNLVGNPYASPINFDTTGWTKSNIQNKYWSYNPNTGAYGVYDADLHTGTNSITRYIASGQGFFVKATATSSKITFTENVKCINSGNNYFKTNESQSLYPMIKIGISNDSTYTDETIVVLDENATALSNDEHDANKWFSDALNIYTLSSDNVNLNIDARKSPSHIDSIKLAVFSYNGADIMTTSHTLVANSLESIPSNVDVVLWDKFLNTYTNLKTNNHYEFMITTDKESYGKERFILLVGDVNIGIDNNYTINELKIFPNPSNNDLFLNTSKEWIGKEIRYSIIDQSGRTIIRNKTTINELNTPIDISSVSDGFYILEIISEQKANRIKFTKRQ